MNIVICAIAKNENNYVKDWCEWHLNLGFNHIYIYDNSESEDKSLKNTYINENVTYIPKYNVKENMLQIKLYDEFYHNYSFDWCAFIDLDEFIVINKWKNIHDFISYFNNYDVIRLNWRIYGDDDLVSRDITIPVYESIKDRKINHRYENHGKSIIKGGINNLNICSCHYCKINDKLPVQVMPDGKLTTGTINGLHKCDEAYINHYMTKTLKEFLEQKVTRGDSCFVNRKINLDYYWDINDITNEKLNYLNEVKQYN